MTKVNYEDFWEGYWNDTTVYGPACRHRRRLVAQLAGSVPHQTILDLGCGDGSLLAELSVRLPESRLTGSDISEKALAIARRNAPAAEFFQATLPGGTLPPGRTFDVVTLSEVLEHIEDDEAVLREVAPIARHVVISVPGGPAGKVDRRYGHFRNYTGDALARKLAANGFEVVLHRRWGWPFYDLQQFLAYREGSEGAATFSQGRYGPLRRLVAFFFYYLYFLNLPGRGTQVVAIGRSTRFNPGR
jgi:SAM-dependent methyltransferase